MERTKTTMRRLRATGFCGLLCAAAAVSLLMTPVVASAQNKPANAPNTGPAVKRTTFDRWHLLCQGTSCAIATNAVRGVLLFGYNASDGKMVMQVRLPTEAPQGRPVAVRLHKSGSVLQLRVGGCQKTFCTAAAAADKTQQVVKILSKEASGTLGYQLAQQMQLEVFSLVGFNKAYAELLKRRPKPKPQKK